MGEIRQSYFSGSRPSLDVTFRMLDLNFWFDFSVELSDELYSELSAELSVGLSNEFSVGLR